jgi:RNA polymerase sigma-70 factor (ECF subfamily)
VQFHAFDSLYLEQLRAGDFRTQEHFVSYFSELIRLKLSKRLRSRAEIDDARQETFARVLTALRKDNGVRQPERLGAFVNSVCNNVLLEYYRSDSQAPQADAEEVQASLPDPALSAVDVIANREMQSEVRHILDQLPEKDRSLIKAIFLLHRAKKSFKSLYLKRMARELRQE